MPISRLTAAVERLPIPVLSAQALGWFRVGFGTLLAWAVYHAPPRPFPLGLHRNYSWLADWSLVHAVTASPEACRALWLVTLLGIGVFVAGIFTRAVYVLVVALIVFGRLVSLQSSGVHDWVLPVLTLIAMTAVPWGDGLSVDAWWRGDAATARDRRGQLYGLAIWLPGLTLGLALAAAAYAKLSASGVAWITTGAVRFHFVEDAANAPTTWGLWIAARPALAVLVSLGAVLVEALFLVNVFLRSPWSRLAFGLATVVPLFAGFYLFQGVFWRPWWVLSVAFLPWALLDRGPRPATAPARLRPVHAVLIAGLAAQQALVSATGFELEPVVSPFAMYSGTYGSPEEFEQVRYRKLQRLRFAAGGEDITEGITGIKHAPETLLSVGEGIVAGTAPDEEEARRLAALRAEYEARFATELTAVTVEAERITFDWRQGVFNLPTRVRIAEIELPGPLGIR